MRPYLVRNRHALIQQIVNLVQNDYLFYVTGRIPDHKDAAAVDRKLLAQYPRPTSRTTAWRWKKQGMARVAYLRHGRFFVLISTHGQGRFLEQERFADIRRAPLRYGGYSVSCYDDKVKVSIDKATFRRLGAYCLPIATRRSVEWWHQKIRALPFQAWRGVQDQVYRLIGAINTERKRARLQPLEWRVCLRTKRRSLKVYVAEGDTDEVI